MNEYYLKYLKYKKKYLHIIRNNINNNINSNINNNINNNKIKGGNINNNKLGHINITDNNIILYAIGDIHGDFQLLKYILTELLKVAKYDNKTNKFTWISKNIYLIFNGDLVDRGGRDDKVVDIEKNDILIINNLIELKKQAKSNNSDILLMTGNHELMIFDQDFRFSTLDKDQKKNIIRGSDFSKLYSDNVLGLLRLNNLLFTHGGICKEMFNPKNYNINFDNTDIINHINILIRKWLKGIKLSKDENKDIITILSGKSASPMWCRTFGRKNENEDCADEIDEDVFNKIKKLDNIPLKYKDDLRMIIAHTIQQSGINPSCSEKVWRIDTGMSRAFDKHIDKKNNINIKNIQKQYKENYRKIQVLEIKMNNKGLYTNFKKIVSNKRTHDLVESTDSLDKFALSENLLDYDKDLVDYI